MPDVNIKKLWIDKGGNLGVECGDCRRTHWSDSLPVINPTTGQECANCKLIKDTNVLETEREIYPTIHAEEVAEYESALAAASEEDKANVKLNCIHFSSQPL